MQIEERIKEVAKKLNACANGKYCKHCEFYSPCAEQCQAKMIEVTGEECRQIANLIKEQEKGYNPYQE